jgi:hypothetical protein
MDISGRSASFTLDSKASHLVSQILDLHLRADDILLEQRHGLFPQRSVRKHQQHFRERVHFELGLYAALRIQQQREGPLTGLQRLDVVR